MECIICHRIFTTLSHLRRHNRTVHSSLADRFECAYCGKIIKRKDDLLRHLAKHGVVKSNNLPECTRCNRSFVSNANLRRHNRTVHSTEAARFVCETCGRTCLRKDALKKHMKVHESVSDLLFECNDCKARFRWKDNLLKHFRICRKRESNSTRPLFECARCCRSFTKMSNLRRHDQTVHSTALFECETCGAKCGRKDALRKHMKVHEPKSDVSLECTQCNRSFSTRRNLLRHNRTQHSTEAERFVCETCGITCARKDVLQKHLKIHELVPDVLYECNDCEAKFRRKYTLSEHVRVCRKRKPNSMSSSVECELCHKLCSNRSNLRRHHRTQHSTSAERFECDICEMKMKRKTDLQRHLTRHAQSDSLFGCTRCHESFDDKSDLRQHVQTAHSTEARRLQCQTCGIICASKTALKKHMNVHGLVFECNDCEAKYCEKCDLLEHIFEKHKSDSSRSTFECDECKTKFRRKDDFIVHVRQKCRKSKNVCAVCRKLFVKTKEVEDHYETHHNLTLQQSELEFQTFGEFEEWKRGVERADVTTFIKARGTVVTLKHTSLLYMCHRTGTYKDKCAGRRRKRFLKQSGSKKLSAHCPAKMCVKIDSASGVCKVLYQETHVGHDIKHVGELCHIYIDKDDKMELASRIVAAETNAAANEQTCRYSAVVEKRDRTGTTSYQDIDNIAVQSDFDDEYAVLLADDDHDVNAYVEQFGESVLYYKAKGDEDTKYDVLEKDDIAIVLMDETQEYNIRLYGHKAVCFDGTHDTNPYGFVLHTMMVLNLYCEGKPVAFLITNRNDKSVIDVFVKCIRERMKGPICTKVFMSDMQQMYLNSWIEVMGHLPEFRLFSTWHVHEAWRRNYSKIPDKEARKAVIQKLTELAVESNPVKFESMLSNFLNESDPRATKFLNYFEKNYADNIPCWAYCYRRNAGLNTNMHLEVSHRALKKHVRDGKKVKTLRRFLYHVQEYFKVQKTKDRAEEVGLQTTHRLKILRERHHRAVEYFEKNSVHVENIDDNTFLVQSFAECQDDCPKMYTVTKRKRLECANLGITCMLECDACGVCFHQFYCDCLDYGVRNNMCKHIHTIGIAKSIVASADVIVDPVTDAEILIAGPEMLEEETVGDEEVLEPMSQEEILLEPASQADSSQPLDHDEKMRIIAEMQQFVGNSLLQANTKEEMYGIRDNFLIPMCAALKIKTESQRRTM